MENDSQSPDDTIKSSQIKDLGTIKIEFRRRDIVGKGRAEDRKFDKDLRGAPVLTEKQLKGKSLTHGVAYGLLFPCSFA